MERNWGDNHQSYLFAKFLRGVKVDELDPRVYEIAKKEYGTVDHFNEKVLAYQIACVASLMERDIEPEYNQGHLPILGKIIIYESGGEETPFDNNRFGVNTKVIFEVGGLELEGNGYNLEPDLYNDSDTYGFWVCIWNNNSADMDQEECKEMLEVYVDAIKKYPDLIEIVKMGSPY